MIFSEMQLLLHKKLKMLNYFKLCLMHNSRH